MTHLEMLIFGLLLDALIGDPDRLWRRIPHPAALMGGCIGGMDAMLNAGSNKRLKGVAALAVLIGGFLAIGCLIAGTGSDILELATVTVLLAHRSLITHVIAVAAALGVGVPEGRRAVSMIVGRDPEALDENGIICSAVESGAENFSDGVVAPAFWFLLFGAPGILVYKIVNTADSMIGHKNTKYQEFGWAAARLDDVMNWVPARLSGVLIAVAAGSFRAFQVMRRDARLHRSPNAGWPESAMAAVLDVAIAGPRSYGGVVTDDTFVNNEGRHDLIAADIRASVKVLWKAWLTMMAGLVFVWVVF